MVPPVPQKCPQAGPVRAMHATLQTFRRLPAYLFSRRLTQSAALPVAEPPAVPLLSCSSSISSTDEDTVRTREPLQLHVPLPVEQLLRQALWTPPPDGSSSAAAAFVPPAPTPYTALNCTVQRVVFVPENQEDYAVLQVSVPDRQFWPQLPIQQPSSNSGAVATTSVQTVIVQPSASRAAHHIRRRTIRPQVAVPASAQQLITGSHQTPVTIMQPPAVRPHQQGLVPAVMLCGRDCGLRKLAVPDKELFVRGQWSQHRKYGTQLQVEEARAVAEKPSAEAAASGPRSSNGSEDFEDAGLAPMDLVATRMAFLRLRNNPKLAQRKSITLSVTDLTAAGWCSLQLAYQTATGERKKQTAQMAQGGDIHENLELEVVQKVEVLPVTAEDEMAVSLLNAVAAIRQLLVEGRTRELRIFAPMQGQWIVGVVDGVNYDQDKHVVSMLENKTRAKRGMPAPEQVDSARLQVMVYRDMYNIFRHLSLQEMEEYLYHHSSTGVGLRPDMPVSASILDLCGHLFPVRSPASNGHANHHHAASSNGHAGVSHSNGHVGQSHSNGYAGPSHSSNVHAILPHSNGHAGTSQSSEHAGLSHSNGHARSNGAAPSSQIQLPATQVVMSSSQGQHVSPIKPMLPGSQRVGAAGQHAVTVTTPTSSHTTSHMDGITASPSTGSQPTSPEQRSLEQMFLEVASGEQPAKRQHIEEQQASQHTPAAAVRQPVDQLPVLTPSMNGQGKQVVRLSDCVRLLHESLQWLPPAGDDHHLQYIWQDNPQDVIGCVDVKYDASWLQPRLTKALDVWAGRRTPQPVSEKQAWKCNFCDFKEQCKKHNPEHPLSDPRQLLSKCMAEKQTAIAERQASFAVAAAGVAEAGKGSASNGAEQPTTGKGKASNRAEQPSTGKGKGKGRKSVSMRKSDGAV